MRKTLLATAVVVAGLLALYHAKQQPAGAEKALANETTRRSHAQKQSLEQRRADWFHSGGGKPTECGAQLTQSGDTVNFLVPKRVLFCFNHARIFGFN